MIQGNVFLSSLEAKEQYTFSANITYLQLQTTRHYIPEGRSIKEEKAAMDDHTECPRIP